MSSTNSEAIKEYYSSTQFEYRLVWNWNLKTTPALHFGYYDEKATNHKQAIVRANEVLAEWAGIQKGATIIDAGCGLGHSSFWLANRYNATVTGISLVPKQIQTINQSLKKNKIENVQFIVADYLHMPFPDNSADVVWAFESVCHAADKSVFYKEAFRVLKPGGKLVMAEYIRTERPLEPQKEQLLKDMFETWAIPDLDTIIEHEAHAVNAGFKQFNTRNVTKHVIISYRNLRETCKRFLSFSKLLYRVGIISSVRFKNIVGSMKQADAIEQNVFTYNHLVASK